MKRKLQDTVTVNFAKGGFRWGWRVALFTSSYVGITTCISVYRGKSSMYEYVAAGTLTGAMYKVNLGLRGIAVGGLLGCILGGVAGGLSLAILKASGTTMEEVRYWQYKWKLDSDKAFQEAIKKRGDEDKPAVELAHDEKLENKKVSLDNLLLTIIGYEHHFPYLRGAPSCRSGRKSTKIYLSLLNG
ncbi:RPII140-upstream gene protein-like [Hermetia illucens]|uniref:RPII140-upstream gene protein-like n=1 Tax=Hermetia illucens TaxID=343691 RepID=UPI0018CC6256|nr:RPII140-upstream gene protein-like [Hermetia illucens]